MGIVSHRVAGLESLRGRIAALPRVASDAAHLALHDIAEGIATQIRAKLTGASCGVSQPGAVPADPSGRLADATEVAAGQPGGVSLTVTVPYARWLEFGTIRMAARPFLRPAALQAAGGARAALVAVVRATLSKPEETGT